MTSLPPTPDKKLGLVIDLDTCVGCQACVTSCKEWNTGGHMAPLTDINPYGAQADGVWFNRVHTYEHACASGGQTVHFPRSCLHCETPACVTVCPTGASYKRAADGIVLVDEDKCIGCQLCSWACPYGARELDPVVGRHEEMHAVHRPHLQPESSGGRARAGLRRRLPDRCAPFRRSRRSGFAGVAAGERARRRRSDAGARLPPDQQIPAAAPARRAARPPRLRRRSSR